MTTGKDLPLPAEFAGLLPAIEEPLPGPLLRAPEGTPGVRRLNEVAVGAVLTNRPPARHHRRLNEKPHHVEEVGK